MKNVAVGLLLAAVGVAVALGAVEIGLRLTTTGG